MPTTSYVDSAMAAVFIGARTNAAAGAVDDVSAEEARLVLSVMTEGALTDAAYLVAPNSGMNLTVGSGAAKVDRFVIAGETAGQENYLARLEAATVAVAVPASDPSQARVDEIYLIVADGPYDGGSLALPRIGYRKGDAGGGNPGVDAAWRASALLARVAVGAAVTSIVLANITDLRAYSFIRPPAGTLAMWPSATAPSGALVRDGAAVSRTTYRRLFSIIGTTFGVGDGSTTFNVPNAKGRVDVGYDASQTEFDALGETGGAKTVALSTAELASHTHGPGAATGAHSHVVSGSDGAGNGIYVNTGAVWDGSNDTLTSNGAHDHGTSAATGSGTAHQNMPPFIVALPIIWT